MCESVKYLEVKDEILISYKAPVLYERYTRYSRCRNEWSQQSSSRSWVEPMCGPPTLQKKSMLCRLCSFEANIGRKSVLEGHKNSQKHKRRVRLNETVENAPITSVDCERSFSHFKIYILSCKRRALTQEHLKYQMVIQWIAKCLNKTYSALPNFFGFCIFFCIISHFSAVLSALFGNFICSFLTALIITKTMI